MIHALLIGIDRYLPPADGGTDGYYPSLKGAVRDAERVEAWLRDEREVAPEQIEKLLAPLSGGEDAEASPTYENMVAALKRLRERARPGDHVWIHYSGHGGRVPTRYGGVKLGDWDEALVPTDVGDPGARYLRDVELAHLFEELAAADLEVTVVLDCCHSGGAFRQGDSESTRRRRGTERVDPTERPAKSLAGSDDELRRTWRRVRKVYRRSLQAPSDWHFEPRGYVLLAACQAHEQAFEDTFDGGHPSGALTHWLLEAARALPRGVTYRELFDRVSARIRESALGQTPQLEGAGDRIVLSSVRHKPVSDVTVLETDPQTGKVLLDLGQAQRARLGSRWAVYRPGSRELTDSDAVVARLELVEIGATSSWAAVVEGELGLVVPGAPALPMPPVRSDRGRRDPVRTVRLREDVSTVPTALATIRRAIAADRILEVLDDGDDEPADFEVAATDRGYEVFGRGGCRLAGVGPVPFTRSQAERFAAWNLVHLARFHDVLETENPDEASPLRGGLALSLHRLAGPPSGPVVESQLLTLSEAPELRVGDWVCLELRNVSYQVLNVTLLELRFSDWQIAKVFPRQSRFQPFEPDEKALIPFQLARSETAVIKAFGTLEATSFDSVQLSAIDRPGRRAYRPLDYAGMEWTVTDLSIETAPGDD